MASYRFRRRISTLFLAAAAALTPAIPPRAAISRSAAVAELPTTNSKNGRGPHRRPLLNLGGPETSEDVEPFLYNLFADPDIIRLPPALAGLQTAIAWLVAKRRAPKSRAAYDSIGGGSPILGIYDSTGEVAREQTRPGLQVLRRDAVLAPVHGRRGAKSRGRRLHVGRRAAPVPALFHFYDRYGAASL